MARRAIGIVRVSERKGREGDSFVSPKDQRARIVEACRRDGIALLDVYEEIDVSGGRPLDERHGLGPAVHAIENGQADVVVVAYFDRLVRSLRVQDEVVSRIEAAGGRVLAVDFGEVTGRSAAQWLSGTMIGAVSEYYRRSIKERSGEAQARAVANGVLPYANVPPGYLRGPDRRLVPDPDTWQTVARAFELRASGTTIKAVRAFLAEHGIRRSYHGVSSLLASRVVLGEINFGELVNLEAHEPIVDRALWERVQDVSVPRGRRAKSFRLLARLGVLRCGTCGSRLVVGTGFNGRYHHYRCPPTGDCPRRVTISAPIAEQVVADATRQALADLEGRASAQQQARAAEQTLEVAQADLDAALRAFGGLVDEPAARERLAELAQARDVASAAVERLGGTHTALAVNASADWDRLTSDAQRALIRAVVERAVVEPGGKGADRITVQLVGQQPSGL